MRIHPGSEDQEEGGFSHGLHIPGKRDTSPPFLRKRKGWREGEGGREERRKKEIILKIDGKCSLASGKPRDKSPKRTSTSDKGL